MQNYQLDIRVTNDTNYQVTFKSSSCVVYNFECDQDQLSNWYSLANIEDLTISMVRKIIKDKRFYVIKTISYDSSVIYFTNYKRTIEFQVEDGLALATNIKAQDEVFFSMQGRTIEQLKNYTLINFNSLKRKRKKITPLSTRIETQLSNFGF